jgi:uncharacterized protein YecT (DUF1311 family)
MNRYLIASILICVACMTINAQKKKAVNDPCKNAMSQAEINLCTRRSYEAANAEMIKVLSLVRKEVSTYEGALEKLETSQLKWVEYRDAACESEAVLYTGGSIRPTILNSCLTSITTERTKRLKVFLEEK